MPFNLFNRYPNIGVSVSGWQNVRSLVLQHETKVHSVHQKVKIPGKHSKPLCQDLI